MKLLSMSGFIRASTFKVVKHEEELECAVKLGRGAIVNIDSNTYGVVHRIGLLYNIAYVQGEKVTGTTAVYFSQAKKYMSDIAPLHEWRPIR